MRHSSVQIRGGAPDYQNYLCSCNNVQGMEAYRQLLSDPLQQVQRLLGHASITTTYVYLDQIAAQADTVDTAVGRLLAVLTDGDVL